MPTADPILASVSSYYSSRVVQYGPTPQGADWSSLESQITRFDQLLRIIPNVTGPFSLIDYGCGYGALLDHLNDKNIAVAAYQGFDISETMLTYARTRFEQRTGVSFHNDTHALAPAAFTVASGVFNVRLQTDVPSWEAYVRGALTHIASLTTSGFAFNLLTHFCDADRIRADLYYADPAYWFDYCRTSFSPRVALLHDYPLYEFTIHVRF
jgi:SAM-dependent methyltransferase